MSNQSFNNIDQSKSTKLAHSSLGISKDFQINNTSSSVNTTTISMATSLEGVEDIKQEDDQTMRNKQLVQNWADRQMVAQQQRIDMQRTMLQQQQLGLQKNIFHQENRRISSGSPNIALGLTQQQQHVTSLHIASPSQRLDGINPVSSSSSMVKDLVTSGVDPLSTLLPINQSKNNIQNIYQANTNSESTNSNFVVSPDAYFLPDLDNETLLTDSSTPEVSSPDCTKIFQNTTEDSRKMVLSLETENFNQTTHLLSKDTKEEDRNIKSSSNNNENNIDADEKADDIRFNYMVSDDMDIEISSYINVKEKIKDGIIIDNTTSSDIESIILEEESDKNGIEESSKKCQFPRNDITETQKLNSNTESNIVENTRKQQKNYETLDHITYIITKEKQVNEYPEQERKASEEKYPGLSLYSEEDINASLASIHKFAIEAQNLRHSLNHECFHWVLKRGDCVSDFKRNEQLMAINQAIAKETPVHDQESRSSPICLACKKSLKKVYARGFCRPCYNQHQKTISHSALTGGPVIKKPRKPIAVPKGWKCLSCKRDTVAPRSKNFCSACYRKHLKKQKQRQLQMES